MRRLVEIMRSGGSLSALDAMRLCRPIDCGYQLLRLGGAADGGYLVPDDLHGLRALFSPGVAESSALELDFAGRGIPCFLADRSVAGPAEPHPLFHFTRKHLGMTNDSSTIRLADWIDANCPGSDDLALQMYIEGAEYRVLQDCPSATLQRFRIIVIELHHCARIARPWANGPIINLPRRLLETHAVAHLHANNQARPRRWFGLRLHPLLEFRFLRRDRLRGSGGPSHLPHPLDRPNVPSKPEWALDPAWLR